VVDHRLPQRKALIDSLFDRLELSTRFCDFLGLSFW